MRIISGEFKGREINFLKNSNTRPLKDAVKENIFNILKHSNKIKIKIENSNILDLYSGIGSFGIECISRGAVKATFVEKEENAVKLLKENLINLSIISRSKIYDSEINEILTKKLKEKFQIFFLDPPFKNFDYFQNLESIKKNKLYKKDHIIIIHREKKSKEDIGKLLKIILIKNYGRSKIIFGRFN